MNSIKITVNLIISIFLSSLTIFATETKAIGRAKIVFASGGVIYIMNPNGSGTIPLASNVSADFPKFSPDGNKIAFSGGIGGNSGIYLMNSDGSDLRFLTSASSYQDRRGISWSPDNKKIAFTCAQLGRICIVNVDGTNRTVIDENPHDYGPDWSPNGSKIAFTRTGNTSYLYDEIFVMDSDGNNQRRLTTNRFPDLGPRWSPDGLKLAFTHRGACLVLSNGEVLCFASYVYSMNAADGTDQTMLAGGDIFDGGFAADPGWSPDGAKIIFWGIDLTPDATSNDIFVVDPSGNNRINLTNTPDFSEHAPDWGRAFRPTSGDFDGDG